MLKWKSIMDKGEKYEQHTRQVNPLKKNRIRYGGSDEIQSRKREDNGKMDLQKMQRKVSQTGA